MSDDKRRGFGVESEGRIPSLRFLGSLLWNLLLIDSSRFCDGCSGDSCELGSNWDHRFSIKERVYPAILPVESKKVTGKVLMGITDPELDVLDTFEDVEYVRRTVEISLIDSSETLLADTYVWGNQDDPDLYGDWDFEEWKRLHMKDFLAMTKGFMEELEQPESKTRVATYEAFFQKE